MKIVFYVFHPFFYYSSFFSFLWLFCLCAYLKEPKRRPRGTKQKVEFCSRVS